MEAAVTPVDLSDREWQVIVLVTQGLSNDEIAERLFLGLNTVKTHVRSGYRKIGARTRSQAAVWGSVHGLLSVAVGVPGAWTDRNDPTGVRGTAVGATGRRWRGRSTAARTTGR
ncbi:response regulator transcription factor [Nocardioides dongxiaopingii]|uniref:response regulator transcription factor n=1 Tax=Nocardioides dongxiaopingii TaxID=2576036 RepID=UPI001BB0B768|nr:LuxR C-terminal-related transcriptional regulator [Nocardioides dongxiaopingii]